jgi:hypothetical protein
LDLGHFLGANLLRGPPFTAAGASAPSLTASTGARCSESRASQHDRKHRHGYTRQNLFHGFTPYWLMDLMIQLVDFLFGPNHKHAACQDNNISYFIYYFNMLII